MADLTHIDGSYGEGGGQVLRTALALAAITGQPVRIANIRAGRRNPGLAAQHLTVVRALARVCAADLDGAALGSTEITFTPRVRPQAATYVVDVSEAAQGGSAGAVTLMLQALLLPLLFADGPSQLTLRGGTHVAWSPSFDYLAEVYLPTVARMGVQATCHLDQWGFYPVGGGQITATITGAGSNPALTPLTPDERGALQQVRGQGVACNLPADIAQRLSNRASNVLREAGLPATITARRVRGVGPGAGLFLTAVYEHCVAGFVALGAKGKPSDKVADEACAELLAHHAEGSPVDMHLADQLLLPMALAQGRSSFRTSQVTNHLLTNAWTIGHFLPAQITIDGAEGSPGTVVVDSPSSEL